MPGCVAHLSRHMFQFVPPAFLFRLLVAEACYRHCFILSILPPTRRKIGKLLSTDPEPTKVTEE